MPPNTFNDLVMEFEAPGPRSQEFFDDAMEAVIDALEQRARLVALGPCAAADMKRGVVRVRCSVEGVGDTLDERVRSLLGIVQDALVELDAAPPMLQCAYRHFFSHHPLIVRLRPSIVGRMSTSKVIRERREARGLTLVGLADAVGVAPSTVWKWEMGRAFPGAERSWRALAAALDTTVGDLFGEVPHVPEVAKTSNTGGLSDGEAAA